MIWVLEARSTDSREAGVRYRAYTQSRGRADRFGRIPRIQFTDGGHGIIFTAEPHAGRRAPARDNGMSPYVDRELRRIEREDRDGKQKR